MHLQRNKLLTAFILISLIFPLGLSRAETIHTVPLNGDGPLILNENSGQEIILDPNTVHIYFDDLHNDTTVKGMLNFSCTITGRNITDAYMRIDNGVWTKAIPGPAPAVPSNESWRPNMTGGPDFSLMFFLLCKLDTTQYSDGNHVLYIKAESSDTGLSNTSSIELKFQNAPSEKPNYLWLWFGAGFIIGGGLIGTGGIILKKHRIAENKHIEPEDAKIS